MRNFTCWFCSLLFWFSFSERCITQWRPINFPREANVQSLFYQGGILYMGTTGFAYSSSNNGTTWTKIYYRDSVDYVNWPLFNVADFTYNGVSLFAGATGWGIFRRTNNALGWELVNQGLTDLNISCLTTSNSTIFAGTSDSGVFRSTNSGNNWELISDGLIHVKINAIIVSDTIIVAATDSGVFRSKDSGVRWSNIKNWTGSDTVTDLLTRTSVLYMSTRGGEIFRSSNWGDSWTEIDGGQVSSPITSLVASSSFLLAGTSGEGIFRSSNNGTNWIKVNSGLTNTSVNILYPYASLLFNGSSEGMFRSSNQGNTWTDISSSLPYVQFSALNVSMDTILIGTNGILRSTDMGGTWQNLGPPNSDVRAVTTIQGTIFFGGYSGGVSGVHRTTNQGLTWSSFELPGDIVALAASANAVFAATQGNGVFVTQDNGVSWIESNNGLFDFAVTCMLERDSILYVGTANGKIFVSSDRGANWALTGTLPGAISENSMERIGPALFVAADSKIYRRIDPSTSWTQVRSLRYGGRLFVSGTTLFASTYDGIIRSSDLGGTWTEENSGLTRPWSLYLLASNDRTLFLGGSTIGIWSRSLSEILPPPCPILFSVFDSPLDQGGKVRIRWIASLLDTNLNKLTSYTIWRSIPDSGQKNNTIADNKIYQAYRFLVSNHRVFEWVATHPARKFKEYIFTCPTLYDSMPITNGLHYFFVSAQTNDPNVFYDSNIDSGYSVDNLSPAAPGTLVGKIVGNAAVLSWVRNTEQDLSHYEIYRSTKPNFDTDTMKALTSTVDTSFSDPMIPPFVNYYYALRALDIHGNRSAKSNVVAIVLVSVKEELGIPTEFALGQNYPNPFNPITVINYQLPIESWVMLKVYDVLGKEIATLVNVMQTAGYKSGSLDATNIPSGVYFYRLEATNISDPSKSFTQVKKMLLLK